MKSKSSRLMSQTDRMKKKKKDMVLINSRVAFPDEQRTAELS